MVATMEITMPQPQPPSEFGLAKKQMILGLVVIFAIYFCNTYFIQTFTIARPRMAADLNGMAVYAWLISIPSLAAAFVTLPLQLLREQCEHAAIGEQSFRVSAPYSRTQLPWISRC